MHLLAVRCVPHPCKSNLTSRLPFARAEFLCSKLLIQIFQLASIRIADSYHRDWGKALWNSKLSSGAVGIVSGHRVRRQTKGNGFEQKILGREPGIVLSPSIG